MGIGILCALMGIFVILLSQKMAKVMAIDKDSKYLETGLKILFPFFGLIFVVIGLLIAFNILQPISSEQIYYTRAYFFIIFGATSLIGSPLITKFIFMKFSENKAVQIIGKSGLYFFYIGIGVIFITAGILELSVLF
jgi:hypothetical protein